MRQWRKRIWIANPIGVPTETPVNPRVMTLYKTNLHIFFSSFWQYQIEAWNRAIPRQDKNISTSDFVCSEHFYESDIKRFDDDIVVDGKVVEKGRRLRQPRLSQDAVPKIFKGPSYLTKPEPKKRLPRDRSRTPVPQKRSKTNVSYPNWKSAS